MHDPVFLRNTMIDAARRGDTDALATMVDAAIDEITALTDSDGRIHHLLPFMPPPCYDGVRAFAVPAGRAYAPPFPLGANGRLTFDMEVGSRATVTLAGRRIVLQRDADGLRSPPGADIVDDALKSSGRQREPHPCLTVRSGPDGTLTSLSGRVLGPGDPAAAAPQVTVDSGIFHVISAQSLDAAGHFLNFADTVQSTQLVRLSDERKAFRHAWGLRQEQLTNGLVGAVALRGLRDALSAERMQADHETLRARISEALDAFEPMMVLLLDAFLKWPFWRPGHGVWPDAGEWDRNSFSNGLVPMNMAILARYLGRAEEPAVLSAMRQKGTSFLAASSRLGWATPHSARKPSLWRRRSGNHGILMLLSFVTAARLLRVTEDEDCQHVIRAMRRTVEGNLTDGSFCEGVHYSLFAFNYLAPLLATYDHPPGRALRELDLRDEFLRYAEWLNLSLDERGRVFANFGDNVGEELSGSRDSTAEFILTAFGPATPPPPPLSATPHPLLPQPPAPAQTARSRARSGREVVVRRFKDRGFLLAAALEDGVRRSGLFVIASAVQVTHNVNHDIGGFCFYGGGLRIGIPVASWSGEANNALGFLDRATGAVMQPRKPRGYDGRLEVLQDGRDGLVCRAGMSAAMPFGGEGKQKIWLRREFVYRPWEARPLRILTQVECGPGLVPFLAFNGSFDGGSSLDAAMEVSGGPEGGEARPLAPDLAEGRATFRLPDPPDDAVRFRFETALKAATSAAADPARMTG